MKKRDKYINIDFLRLFRLCKNLGFVKSKRKMPFEYKYPIIANKKLLFLFVKKLFDGHTVVTQQDAIVVKLTNNVKDAISFCMALMELKKEKTNLPNLNESLNLLKLNNSGFVIPYLPNEIRILYISNCVDSKFNKLVSEGVPNPNRPKENLYSCAKACLEYKKVWDTKLKELLEFYMTEYAKRKENEEKALVEKMQRRKVRKQLIEGQLG